MPEPTFIHKATELAGEFRRLYAFVTQLMMIFPVSSAVAPESPRFGKLWYDETATKWKLYNGATWDTIS